MGGNLKKIVRTCILYSTVYVDTKMDRFVALSLDEIGARYKYCPRALVDDLMSAGLLLKTHPTCHGEMSLSASDPWCWRSGERTCCAKVPVARGSFFDGFKKKYEIFKGVYMWAIGEPQARMLGQCNLTRPTLRKLISRCQEVISAVGLSLTPQDLVIEGPVG